MLRKNYKKANLKVLAKKLIDVGLFEYVEVIGSIIDELDENQSIQQHMDKYCGDVDLRLECTLEALEKAKLCY